MSDNPIVPGNSDPSHHVDPESLQATAIGRRRMVTALLHGRSQSGADRRRQWPLLLAGVVVTGLTAAGMGIAEAYQDQQRLDAQEEPTAPVETTEPTPTPTTPAPTSAPVSPPTKPSTPAPTKQPPPTKKLPPPKSKTQTSDKSGTSQPTDKSGSTKSGANQGGSAKGGATKDRTGTSGGSKNRR